MVLAAVKPFPHGGAPPPTQPTKTSFSSLSASRNSPPELQNAKPVLLTAVHSVPPIHFVKRLPNPELGLLSVLFALSVSIGAIISVALISIPTLIVIKRSKAAMEKLVRLAKQEVPVTLYSLRLSGMEIGDLIRELKNLRKLISGNWNVKK